MTWSRWIGVYYSVAGEVLTVDYFLFMSDALAWYVRSVTWFVTLLAFLFDWGALFNFI